MGWLDYLFGQKPRQKRKRKSNINKIQDDYDIKWEKETKKIIKQREIEEEEKEHNFKRTGIKETTHEKKERENVEEEKERERLENITIQDIEKMISEKDLPNIIGALENCGIDALHYNSMQGNSALNERIRKVYTKSSGLPASRLRLKSLNESYNLNSTMFSRYHGKEWDELYDIYATALEKLKVVGTMNNSDIHPIVDYFLERINNKSDWYKSIHILGFIGDEKVVKALDDILNGTENEDRCEAVIEALGPLYKRTKDQRILQVCITALGDRNIGREAAKNLGEIGDLQAVKPLIKAISVLDFEDISQSMTAETIADALADIEALNGGEESFITDLIKSKEKGIKNIDFALNAMAAEDVGIEYEKLEMYEEANEWYNTHGLLEEAASARRKKADMAAPKTEIHGDYVDDRDTIVKDSVISKSNIGAGGDDKFTRLEKLKEMFDSGFISKEEMEEMKKEILGK